VTGGLGLDLCSCRRLGLGLGLGCGLGLTLVLALVLGVPCHRCPSPEGLIQAVDKGLIMMVNVHLGWSSLLGWATAAAAAAAAWLSLSRTLALRVSYRLVTKASSWGS
jgi:hypothetical protein